MTGTRKAPPKPGTYPEAEQNPQWTLYNSGVLFGAIDVALFIIVIGGFLAAPSATASSTRLVILLVGLAVGIFVVLATPTGSTGTRRGRWSTT